MNAQLNIGKILLADDHPLFRTALRQALTQLSPGVVIEEAHNLDSLQALVVDHADADLLLLDLHMPGVTGFSALVYLRGRHPALPVLVCSGDDDPNVIRRAIGHGALGFIPKSVRVEVIAAAITAVLEGEIWVPADVDIGDGDIADDEADVASRMASLTPQQFRVLMMLGQGLLNKQIAYDLDVSEATIKAHVSAIMRKLQVSNRTQAVVQAARLSVEAGRPAMR